jgi:hypothetical protein
MPLLAVRYFSGALTEPPSGSVFARRPTGVLDMGDDNEGIRLSTGRALSLTLQGSKRGQIANPPQGVSVLPTRKPRSGFRKTESSLLRLAERRS